MSHHHTLPTPEKLFSSALHEVVFGAGSYRILANTHAQAKKLHTQWDEYLMAHPFSDLLFISISGNQIAIQRSGLYNDIVQEATGMTWARIEYAGSRSLLDQEQILTQLRTYLEAQE